MRDNAPPIVKLAQRVRAEVETAVSSFPRKHRYLIGTDLRREAMDAVRLAQRAWRDRARQPMWVERLVWKVDDLKATHQCAMDVRAFASFAQFEALSRSLSDLGKQCGGWQKKQRPQGQNRTATSPAPSERAQILSDRGASQAEAHA